MWDQGHIQSFWGDKTATLAISQKSQEHCLICRFICMNLINIKRTHIFTVCLPFLTDEIIFCPGSPGAKDSRNYSVVFNLHSSEAKALATTLEGFRGYYTWQLRFVLRSPTLNLEIFVNRIFFFSFFFILEATATRNMAKLKEKCNRFSTLP